MMNYDTFTFSKKSHWNEFAPDIKVKAVVHQEDNLDRIIELMASFLYSCGYSENSIKSAMAEYAEE